MTYVARAHYGRMVKDTIGPSERLAAELKRLGIKPTNLAKRLGVGYQTVYRWTRGRNFNESNQKLVIDELDWADDFFSDPEAVQERERQRGAAYQTWLKTSQYAADASEVERKFLRRLLPDNPEFLPDHAWYDVQLALLRNKMIRIEADAVAQKNREIDAAIQADESEPEPKPPKKTGPKKPKTPKK